MRLRSIAVVANLAESVDEGLASAADALVIDLADASKDPGLRAGAAGTLQRIRAAGKGAGAIINHPRTQLTRQDLDAAVTADLGFVLLPHTVEPQDVRDVGVLLREFEYTRGFEPGTVLIFPVIDSARGLLRAAEIAQAAPRVGGLVFDSPAYARDTGARDEEHGARLSFARGAVVAAARAVDGLPLIRASAFELQQLSHYGFGGMLLADGRAASAVNTAFTPTAPEVIHARAQLAAYSAARAEGAWVARIGGEVVDADSARKARLTLEQAGEEA